MVNRAIELAGPLPLLLDSRAVVHLARKEAAQALEDLESISADKTDPVWLFHKARGALACRSTSQRLLPPWPRASTRFSSAMIDPPERPLFDRLHEQLLKGDSRP